jgi:uncharacterized protein YprB with RNaseH-like and TPR domain
MGRQFSVTDEEIKSLVDKGYSISMIAEELHKDPSTIYRHLKTLKPTEATENDIPDEQTLKEFNEDFPINTTPLNLDFACFDLETTNLTADFSVVLCACIKPFGKPAIVFRADECNKNWATKRMDDSAIVKAVASELAKHSVLITHYGSKFDIPYIKAKMVKYGIMPLPPMFNIDTWRIAKNNFQVSSRRLANLSLYFSLGQKSGVDGPLWMNAGMDGDKKAMDMIVEHNIQDVLLLERLAALSFPYVKSIPKV